jgi:hypothetical protein
MQSHEDAIYISAVPAGPIPSYRSATQDLDPFGFAQGSLFRTALSSAIANENFAQDDNAEPKAAARYTWAAGQPRAAVPACSSPDPASALDYADRQFFSTVLTAHPVTSNLD